MVVKRVTLKRKARTFSHVLKVGYCGAVGSRPPQVTPHSPASKMAEVPADANAVNYRKDGSTMGSLTKGLATGIPEQAGIDTPEAQRGTTIYIIINYIMIVKYT